MSLPKQNLITADYQSGGTQSFLPTQEASFLGDYLWANRPAATAVTIGSWFRATDLNYGHFRSDGVNWKVQFPTLIAKNITLLNGVNSVAEQYLGSVATPAGLLFVGAVIEWKQGYARSDATDATNALTQRIGPLGTIADALGNVFAATALTTTVRTAGMAAFLRVSTSSTFIREGSAGTVSPPYGGSTSISSSPFGTAGAVQNLAAPIYFGAALQLAAATGTTLPQITNQEIWMWPS